MSFDLYVDARGWHAHLDAFAAEVPGLVPVIKGNGYTAGLLNGNRPALFVLMTCLNGLFQNPDSDSFAEALVRADAGAVAVWASSGLTRPNEQTLMNQELVRQLFAREVSTIGEVIRRAKMHVGDPDIRRTWILFGDPTTSVR